MRRESEGVSPMELKRQRRAFIEEWLSSPFFESVGIHIRWNYRVVVKSACERGFWQEEEDRLDNCVSEGAQIGTKHKGPEYKKCKYV